MDIRKPLLILLGTGCAALGHAANFLTVHLEGGTKISFAIAGHPKILLSDGTFTIGTGQFLVSNIRKYTLGDQDETTSIEAEKQPGLSFYPNPAKDYVYIRTDKDVRPRLYSLSGVEFPVKYKKQEGLIVLDLRGLKSDMYLMIIGKETLKIQKQ